MEKLEIVEDAYIETSSRLSFFKGYVILSHKEIYGIMHAIYSEEEVKQIIEDASSFYGEDDKTNALHDDFYRILEGKGKYKFD